jgi:hypothetical protein
LADGPLWALSTGYAESLELEFSAKIRSREKISHRAYAESYSRQRLCREFDALCREFQTLGKAWISSSETAVILQQITKN